MAVSSNFSGSGWQTTILASLVEVRSALNKESLKLSSGRVANSYSQLGNKVAPTIDLRARLNSLDTYRDLIASANTTIAQVSQSLTSLNKLADHILSGPLSLAGGSDKAAQSATHLNLATQFSTLVSYLNNQDSSGYSFGGDQTGMPPVVEANAMLDGLPGKAGLKQLFAERFAADSGADDLGRLSLSTAGGSVTVSEAGTTPFGLKLSTITSGLTNATVSGPTGTPPTETVIFSGVPSVGDNITFSFKLPDGSTGSIGLTVANTAGVNQFAVGSTPDETALNMQIALSASISKLVATDLKSASALYTAKNFFAASADSPPERVAGAPASSATSVTAGTSANTVIWYQGKNDSADPRPDRKIQIGAEMSVEFGVRANEQGFQSLMAGTTAALLVASTFSVDTMIAAAQMESIRSRSYQVAKDGQLGVQSIAVSVASSQMSSKLVEEQNKSVKALIQSRLSEIEDAKPEETAVRISSLTTQLQASYQIASKLLNLSLSAYL